MKKFLTNVFFSFLVVLVFSPAVFADTGPAQSAVIPEVIWAPATGGGTWVTALQIQTNHVNVPIHAQFHYGTTFREVTLGTLTTANECMRFSNVLQTMGTIDTAFDYYGKVGALFIYTDAGLDLCAQAMTTNGNYGKTMPGYVGSGNIENTATVDRRMLILGTMYTSTFRTFAGFWNCTPTAMTVRFFVFDDTGHDIGNMIEKTIPSYGFLAFNPFSEAGITTYYTNTYLHIYPVSGGTGGVGLFCFGSLANNITNDTYALTAIPES